jgi:hypothetical protein
MEFVQRLVRMPAIWVAILVLALGLAIGNVALLLSGPPTAAPWFGLASAVCLIPGSSLMLWHLRRSRRDGHREPPAGL